MACPNCKGLNTVSEENYRREDEFTTVIDYTCEDCGCEWTETTTIEITKQGDEDGL